MIFETIEGDDDETSANMITPIAGERASRSDELLPVASLGESWTKWQPENI